MRGTATDNRPRRLSRGLVALSVARSTGGPARRPAGTARSSWFMVMRHGRAHRRHSYPAGGVSSPSLSGCVETPRSPGVTREGVTGDSLVSSNSPGLPGAGDHLAAGSIEAVPDPAARPVRRSFTAAYRARVVAEYEAAPRGSKAAVLRREGLYQSQIREWY